MKKRVLIIEPIGSGIALVEAAISMQWDCYLLSHNKKDRELPNILSVEKSTIIEVDTNDIRSVLEKLSLLDFVFDAVLPGNEYYVALSIKIAKFLNLTTLPDQLIEIAHDKLSMRKHLEEYSIRSVWFKEIYNIQEIKENDFDFPCVIKPKASAGSFHVNKANNLEELKGFYLEAQNDEHKELGHGIDEVMIVEEYLMPPEYSLEGFFSQKKFIVASLTKKFLSLEPCFVEMGHVTPAYDIDEEMFTSIKSYIEEALLTTKVDVGVVHAEIRFNKNNLPVIVEIAFRLPGDHIVELIKMSKGIDLAQAMLCSYTNLEYSFKDIKCSQKIYSGISFFDPVEITQLSSNEIEKKIEILKSRKSVVSYVLKKPSSKTLKDYRDRCGYVIVSSESLEDTLETMNIGWGR